MGKNFEDILARFTQSQVVVQEPPKSEDILTPPEEPREVIVVEMPAPVVKGETTRLFAYQTTAATSNDALVTRNWNAVHVHVQCTGSSPSAVVTIQGARAEGGNYVALETANGTRVITSSIAYDVMVGADSVKVNLASVSGSITVDLTPFIGFGGEMHEAPSPSAVIAGTAITGLDGAYTPLSTDSRWVANPGNRTKARVRPSIVVRATTALLDNPSLSLVAYVRHGTYVCKSAIVSAVRPRLTGLSSVIKFLFTTNTGSSYTDNSTQVNDGSQSTYCNLSAFGTLTANYVAVIGPVPFCGVALNMDASVNTNASVMTVKYWNGAWTTVANLTDGSALSGATLGQTGQLTWDLPSDWASTTINALTGYAIQISFGSALSAAVHVTECDLLQPITDGLDVTVNGDDILVQVQSQDQSVTGTPAYSGTVNNVEWMF